MGTATAIEADRLHDLDTSANLERAWLFRALTALLTAVLVLAVPPTQAVGRGGWLVASAMLAISLAVSGRIYLARGRVGAGEMAFNIYLSVVFVAVLQWLAGGYHTPIEIIFALHVLGAAGVLKGRTRALHVVSIVVAVLAPVAYGRVSAGQIMVAVVFALVIVIEAGFLYEYGQRLRTHRLALYEAEREASRRAVTDALTGLGNRRALERELESAAARAAAGEALTIIYLDLDGFKIYNDRFGHATGDALLRRLGVALGACIEGHGRAFRIGGDEFCAVLDGEIMAGDLRVEAVRAALSEQGPGFQIGPSCGVVSLPGDAADLRTALRLADERMYEAKRGGRPTPAQEISRVLMLALNEHRLADAGEEEMEVGELGKEIALELGLSADEADAVGRAAELHDIGKIAIPDAILIKPGSLDASEWALMRQHTLIGERILSGSPSFREVARLVRHSHERLDGTGYPDRLAGEQISLGARIVAVCDAYAAMVCERPYRRARRPDQALAELARCAGTQFDGLVVETLAERVAARAQRTSLAAA